VSGSRDLVGKRIGKMRKRGHWCFKKTWRVKKSFTKSQFCVMKKGKS